MREKEEVKKKKKKRDHIRIKNDLHTIKYISTSTMLRTTALLAALCGASAVELTSDNFDELVTKTGKASFIKFQAPW